MHVFGYLEHLLTDYFSRGISESNPETKPDDNVECH
jgi:hypothetical protein